MVSVVFLGFTRAAAFPKCTANPGNLSGSIRQAGLANVPELKTYNHITAQNDGTLWNDEDLVAKGM